MITSFTASLSQYLCKTTTVLVKRQCWVC